MDALSWWPWDLNNLDKKETAFALSLVSQVVGGPLKVQPKQEKNDNAFKYISKRGFILAFEYLPYNLPEWPVGSTSGFRV